MTNKTNLFRLAEGIIILFLIALRVATIYQAGLIDYDAVRNWQIVQELDRGNFSHLYHHVSPGFFLFYSIWQPLEPGLYFYPILNALLNIAGIWLLSRWFKKQAALSEGVYLGFLILLGTSFLLISTARIFSIESPSLLLFAIIFIAYHRRFSTQKVIYFYRTILWLALAITVNYKFLLLLPMALLFEIRQRDQVVSGQRWLKGMGLLASVLVVSVVLSWVLGLRPLQYLYAYGSLFLSGEANAANRMGIFRWDIDFYFRYLLEFEAWLLVPGIFLFNWFYRNQLGQKYNLSHYAVFTAWVTLCWLAGMSVLLKAPRGILFALPLVYMLAFLGWQRFLTSYKARVYFLLLILTGIGQNIVRYHSQIWPYRQTSYNQVGVYLKQRQVKNNISAVSNLAAPFLPAGASLVSVFRPEQFDTVQARKYDYLLLDNYIYPTQAVGFLPFTSLPAQASWREPTLQSFYLYLEHAEFTGFTYKQTRRIYETARQDSVQIRLIPMPAVLQLFQQRRNKLTGKSS